MESKSEGIFKTLSALREAPSFKVPWLYKDLGYRKAGIKEKKKLKQFLSKISDCVCFQLKVKI